MGPICLQGLHRTAEGDKICLPAIEHSNRLDHDNIVNCLVDDTCQIACNRDILCKA
jgi:hypothetical protein